jgi:hypothetical protein
MNTNVGITAIGSVIAAIIVSRQLRRKTSSTITGKEPADENRVAHAGDRFFDELGEIVDTADTNAGRKGLGEAGQRRIDTRFQIQDVCPDLLCDADRDGIAAIARHEQRAIRSTRCDGPDIPYANGRAVLDQNRRVGNVVEVFPQSRREREMLQSRLLESADRYQRVLGVEGVGNIDYRELGGVQLRWIENDLHFPRVARQYLDRSSAGYPRQFGFHDIRCVVEEVGRRQRASHAQDEYRKDLRRHPFDLDLRIHWQVARNLGNPVLHLLERDDHVLSKRRTAPRSPPRRECSAIGRAGSPERSSRLLQSDA